MLAVLAVKGLTGGGCVPPILVEASVWHAYLGVRTFPEMPDVLAIFQLQYQMLEFFKDVTVLFFRCLVVVTMKGRNVNCVGIVQHALLGSVFYNQRAFHTKTTFFATVGVRDDDGWILPHMTQILDVAAGTIPNVVAAVTSVATFAVRTAPDAFSIPR